MAVENKEDLIKKIAVLEAENLKLHNLVEELNQVKKQLLDAQKRNEELIASGLKKLAFRIRVIFSFSSSST